jgi:Sulfotransferase family
VEPALRYEKRVLKLVQWRNPRRRWVLKEPMHLYRLSALHKVFPDACLIWPHRDPVRALASLVSLIGTVQWGRSDHPFKYGSQEYMTDPAISAAAFDSVIEQLQHGVFPPAQVFHLLYRDLVADTLGTIERLYRHFGMVLSEPGRAAMGRYLTEHSRDARPPHRFHAGSPEAIARARAAFRRYQQTFAVPDERTVASC